MKNNRMKSIILGAGSVLIAAAAYLLYLYDQPTPFEAETGWQDLVSKPELNREHFFIQSGKYQLEAELIMPVDGKTAKPAIIFSPGSSDSLYQNYSPGLIEKYVLDVFLPRDFAVLFVNKRGMGESQGNWLHNDFQGRADDLYAAVQYLQTHPSIDAENIGLIGHSQGGWIVTLAAAQHSDIAFFISLVGPMTTVEEQMEDMYESDNYCQGFEGEELARLTAKKLKVTRFGASVGRFIPLGIIGFDAGIIDYDPHEAIQTVTSPGLFVYGGNDILVPADDNIARFNEIFNDNPPAHLSIAVISQATHGFRITESMCTSYQDSLEAPLSEELTMVLNNWLTELGY